MASSPSHHHALNPLVGLPQAREVPAPSIAERRTRIVTIISAGMMGIEVIGGGWFGSMALLADGLHMASHTLAMGIAVFAYVYARRHADDPRFAFGTGKVNALGGYTGATLLGATAVWMLWESLERLWAPGSVRYGEATVIAAIGLVVNVVSAWLLRHDHTHDPVSGACNHAHDHNLRAAYMHVMADAATSALAIIALLCASAWNLPWLDPLVGVAGGALVAWWAVGLLASSSSVLLDHRGPSSLIESVTCALESEGDRVVDVRCWAVAPGRYAVAASVQSGGRSAVHYKHALARDPRIAWTTVEVHE